MNSTRRQALTLGTVLFSLVGVAAALSGRSLLARSEGAVQDATAPSLEDVRVSPAPSGATPMFLVRNGQLTAEAFTLTELLTFALAPDGVRKPYQVTGGDPWVEQARFTLTARVNGGPVSNPRDLMPVFREVLFQVFQLRANVEPADLQVLALHRVPASAVGPVESTINCGEPGAERCGLFGGPGQIVGRGATLQQLSTRLESIAGIDYIVINRTEIEGRFDFSIEFPVADRSERTTDQVVARVEELSESLRRAMGLALTIETATVPSVVIEHAIEAAPSDDATN